MTEPMIPKEQRNRIFISYSREDRVWLEKLQTMLKPLVKKGTISVWDDTQVFPGEQWKEEITKALEAANMAVLLVSANFLASDFIAKHELPKLLSAAKQKGLKIIWIYLSSCLYEDTEIADYQAAHDISRPLNSLAEAEQNKVLLQIGKCIKAAIGSEKEQGSISPEPVYMSSDRKINTGGGNYEGDHIEGNTGDTTDAQKNTRRRLLKYAVLASAGGGAAFIMRILTTSESPTPEPTPTESPTPEPNDNIKQQIKRLEYLLSNGRWKEADQQTDRVMRMIAVPQAEDFYDHKKAWIEPEKIANLPCGTLQTIDKLWVNASNGRFGFSVQRNLWQSVGGVPDATKGGSTYNDLAEEVGWRDNDKWLPGYNALTFDLSAPSGHFPAYIFLRLRTSFDWFDWGTFFSHIQACNII